MTRNATFATLALSALLLGPSPEGRAEDDNAMTYQLRTYRTAPGKLDALVERFGRVNLPLFERHEITLVGAWTPHESDEGGERLVYLVAFPSKAAAEEAWEAFITDPEWMRAFAIEKQEHGQVVTGVEAVYLAPTDYSPALPSAAAIRAEPGIDEPNKDERGIEGGGPRLFELRHYTASPGKLDALNARFRDHTMELFAKHGMTNILYTTPLEGEAGAGEALIYFLAHPGEAEALNAWESFRTDPAWIKARDESQPDGVPLAAKVERWMLVPTDFSPLK